MSYDYIIDSSAWIDYFEGTSNGYKLKRLIEQEEIATSVVAIAEIADKFERNGRKFEIMLEFIRRRSAILPVSVEIALRAAKLKNEIRKRRAKFGISDGIHLATALEEGATLVTSDSDFEGLERVLII